MWSMSLISVRNETIKGSFILQHPHVKAVFGRKKCPVKIGPENGGFYGNLSV